MSSPKLLAYKAIIEHVTMLNDVLKNPDIIRDAGKAYADSIAMSEAEIAKREEALHIIENAKAVKESLEQQKLDFKTESTVRMEKIAQREAELSAKESEVENSKADANKKHAEALRIKSDADEKSAEAYSKLEDISDREDAHKNNLAKFALQQKELVDDKEKVTQQLADITARENKIKQAFA